MGKDQIYAIILNYNNAEDTIECLRSFEAISHLKITKVVVDNASNDDCIGAISKYVDGKTDCVFIETGANLGYAGGNNVGIKYAIEYGADYIAIVNNDVIVNETSFDECIRLLKNEDKIGFVGPAILEYGSDSIQYTGGRINYDELTSPHMNARKEYKKSPEQIMCDYVGGACMMFKPQIVEYIGFIPECYFLFWEETEWCARALQKGFKCVCTMNGYINHKGSVTIKKIKGIENYYLERNRVIFSLRNDPKKIRSRVAITKLIIKAFIKGFIRDKIYFDYLSYYIDAIRQVDRYGNIKKL